MLTRKFLGVAMLFSACACAAAAPPRFAYRVTRVAPLISQGFAINNAGATVGDYQSGGAGAHAFLTPGRDWTSAIDLGALDAFQNPSIANDINDRNQVVGTSNSNSGQRGFLYAHGVLGDVNAFAPAHTTATGNNNAGQIVGAYRVRLDPCHDPADAPGAGALEAAATR